MKNLFIIFFVNLLLQSCAMDYFASANIENASGQPIEVVYYYNRSFYDSAWEHNSAAINRSILSKNSTSAVPFVFDSIHLNTSFTLPLGQTLNVVHVPGGRGVKPRYDELDSIRVSSANGIVVADRNTFEKIFQKNDKGTWVWTIK
jgi:hypothetical protein